MFLNMQIFLDLSQTLEDFSENSWKILGRLLEDFLGSSIFYARRLPTKSSGSFLKYSGSLQKSSAQSGTIEWCQMESKLIYVEEWYLRLCVIVLFMVCFMICMCTILVMIFCKLEEMLIKRIWYICWCFSKTTWHYL